MIRHPFRATLLTSLCGLLPLLASCGAPPKSLAELEPTELLELLHEEKSEVTLDNLVEVDLGRFRVTHPAADQHGPLLVSFQLAGLVYESKQPLLETKKVEFEKRFRDAVITLVQQAESDQLGDPRLSHFKAEILALLNSQLRARAVRDVIFSDFSVEPS